MDELLLPPSPWWAPSQAWRYRLGPPWEALIVSLTNDLTEATAMLKMFDAERTQLRVVVRGMQECTNCTDCRRRATEALMQSVSTREGL